MTEYFAIFRERDGRQVTAAYTEVSALVADGIQHGCVKKDKHGWPQMRKGYERCRTPAPSHNQI